MFKLSCPACGGEVIFRSTASVYAGCSYCKSASVRHDMNLETYGSMADVQMDATPLQINTRGRFNKKNFELIGRLRIGWANGFWNEWYALFDDGQQAWLAEAQGFYAMNFESHELSLVPASKDIFIGRSFLLQSSTFCYEVDDIKKAACIGSEGELPFPAPIGRKCLSVDLSAPNGLFACIEYTERERRLFYGQYVEFKDFRFSFLRDLDGW